MCDVGAVPTTPTIDGTYVQADQGMPPATTGGDPMGTWQFTKLTSYLPGQAKGVVDEKMSTSVGTGYAKLDATGYVIATKFHTTLVTSLLGTIEQDTDNKSKGTFTVSGDTLMLKADCATGSAGDQAAPPKFSRVGDAFTLVLTVKVMGGTAVLVFEGKPLP